MATLDMTESPLDSPNPQGAMTTATVCLSDEEMRRLEELSKREGLTVEQLVRLSINHLIRQPDNAFRAAAKRVMEKNAELFRRLS